MEITNKDVPKLEKLYYKAVKEAKHSFSYKGQEVLTAYCKYLLEYLKSR